MSGEYDPQFQLLEMKTWTRELIVKTTIKHQVNFVLPSPTFVGDVNLALANSQVTILRIAVGKCVRNPQTESIEGMQLHTLAAREQVIFA